MSSFPPPFRTSRLSFVPIDADQHAASVFEIRGDADVMKYSINHAPDPSIEDTHAWLSKFNRFDQAPTQSQSPFSSEISPIGYVIQEIQPCPTTTPPTTNGTNGTPNPAPQETPKIIGATGLRLSVSPVHGGPDRRWEIGYVFHSSAWGRGIATETVSGLIKVIRTEGVLENVPGLRSGSLESGEVDGETKEQVKIKKVLAACTDARNEASRRVLEKCGFVLTGEFLDAKGRGNFEFEYVF